jgi:cbb3-type cytochrome oxidase subunit 3
MSKIIKNILQDVSWLHDFSGILTLVFTLIFIAMIIGVIRWKKEKVEEYKNIPLDGDNHDADNL